MEVSQTSDSRSDQGEEGNSIALEGGGRKSKKKWHVKVENYKTNMWLWGAVSKLVWLIQRKRENIYLAPMYLQALKNFI